MSHSTASPTNGIPVLGVLSLPARIAVVVTVALAVATILVDVVFHVLPPTVVFVMAAVSILGLAWLVGLGTERLGAITGPDGQSNGSGRSGSSSRRFTPLTMMPL